MIRVFIVGYIQNVSHRWYLDLKDLSIRSYFHGFNPMDNQDILA